MFLIISDEMELQASMAMWRRWESEQLRKTALLDLEIHTKILRFMSEYLQKPRYDLLSKREIVRELK